MATNAPNCERYCPAGPCADTCLRMDDPNPIGMHADQLGRTAARIREARDGQPDADCPAIPLRRATEIYYGRTAPSARELALYAEACGVTVDWLLTGIKAAREATGGPVSAPEGENGPMGVRVAADAADGRTAVPAEVWIAGTADAFVVHATEEGAKAAVIEAWQTAMDRGDPDGPYSWMPIDGADGAFELVIREGEFRTLHPGFQIHRAPVQTP